MTPQINAELYAQRHSERGASPVTVKLVTAWLAGFTTASIVFILIGLWAIGVA